MSVFDIPINATRRSYTNPTPPRAVNGQFRSGPVAFEWRGLATMSDRLAANIQKIDEMRVAGAEKLAADMLAYMQANAPWKDRTGDARSTLQTMVIDSPQEHQTTVYAGYGVFYGVFLERRTYNGRSYAIIKPTIKYFSGKLSEYMAG